MNYVDSEKRRSAHELFTANKFGCQQENGANASSGKRTSIDLWRTNNSNIADYNNGFFLAPNRKW